MFKLRKLIPCSSIKLFTPETMSYYGNYYGGLGYGYNGLGCSYSGCGYGGCGCGYGWGYGGLGCGYGWGSGVYGYGGSRPSCCRRYCSYGFYWDTSKETQPVGPPRLPESASMVLHMNNSICYSKSRRHPKGFFKKIGQILQDSSRIPEIIWNVSQFLKVFPLTVWLWNSYIFDQ